MYLGGLVILGVVASFFIHIYAAVLAAALGVTAGGVVAVTGDGDRGLKAMGWGAIAFGLVMVALVVFVLMWLGAIGGESGSTVTSSR